MSKLLCDLSNNNGEVNFDKLKNYGVWGVCLKATQGTKFIDPTFSHRARRAREAGLVVLSYHFCDFSDPVEEANHYANVIHPAKLNGRPMLDVEIPSGTINVETWCRDFNKHLRYRRGLPLPLFYSDPAYIAEHHFTRTIGAGLVLASYGRDDGKDYPYVIPEPWRTITAHQFTNVGRLPGVVGNVDVWHSTHPYRLKLSRILEWWEK